MSGLQQPLETEITGVDVQERGNSLRVATNTPHLVSLGCGRLSTAVTIHPIKQGRITIGSDHQSDIRIEGTGVQPSHCHIENSHDVVTLYPLSGDTTVDGSIIDKPVRLSQGCMIGIGRSNYLRFNHPAEANLMKSVLPNSRISMAPIHFLPADNYPANQTDSSLTGNEIMKPQDYGQMTNGNNMDSGVYMDGHKNLEKELDMTYREMSKRKPPVVPRKTYREFDQISNSSNSDQEATANSGSFKPEPVPKTNSIMSKVSKFEYYVRNSQKNTKNGSNVQPQNADVWSPKVFTSNSLTVNTPAKDVLVNKDVPTNYSSQHRNNNVNNVDLKGQRKIMLNENNAVEAKNCSYTNVVVKNQVIKIDQMAKSYQGVLSKTQNVDRNQDKVPNTLCEQFNDGIVKTPVKLQAPSASFNRNPKFSLSNVSNVDYLKDTVVTEAEIHRQQAQRGRIEEEDRKVQEEARLEEILNMCAEYEKQISLGIPTTPTEKKHNKIITNGSLPRGIHNSPNIVQTSDGYFRFDTSHNRTDYSPHRHPSPSPQSPLQSQLARSPHSNPRLQLNSKNLSSYENVQMFSPNNSAMSPQYHNSESGPLPIPSHHSSYENFNMEVQSPVQNVRQFPITELSSPIMIRKIARNAQNNSNYVGSYERNFIQNCEFSPTNLRQNNIVSPYENVMIKNNVLSIGNVPYLHSPKSPNSHSPRTRIKTTYAQKNVVSPQHFVFPSPPPLESDYNSGQPAYNNKLGKLNAPSKCQGIEKQLLTEDIPMIDDTEFANELEMRIAKLKPENRANEVDSDKTGLLDPDNIFGGQRRNFEEIKRDLIADIPELDEIYRRINGDLSQSKSCTDDVESDSVTNALKKISEEMKGVQLEDEVFEEGVKSPVEAIETPPCQGIVVETVIEIHKVKFMHEDSGIEQGGTTDEDFKSLEEKQNNEVIKAIENVKDKVEEEKGRGGMEDKNETKEVVSELAVVDKPKVESTTTNGSRIEQDIKTFVEQESDLSMEDKREDISTQLEVLRCKRKEVLTEIHKVKCKMADIRSQEDDILRELEMEKALIQGEYDSEIAILNLEQGKLIALQDKIRNVEQDAQRNREQQEERQAAQREKVNKATQLVHKIEENFNKHDATLEELRNAQESLENERKIFEDMEFQDLEEEADWLAYREELQNDISALTLKIDTQKSRILNLRFETSNNLNAAVEETKSLQAEYVKLLNRIEELTNRLQNIEEDIKAAVREIGTDSDKRNSSLEERRSRIKSGDFSPPSSDNEDMEYFENRKKSLNDKFMSMDQMSRSMIVDLGEKRSIDDLLDKDRSMQSTEVTPNKVIEVMNKESSPVRTEISNSSDKCKTESDVTPEREKKGFWERNFDSLSRLKSKEKKNKQKVPDIMSQSLNENMFFNNDNIESEYGSFEKCDSLRSSKRSNKSKSNNSPNSDKPSKISFSSLGRIIKKDSFKKSKDDKTNRHSAEICSNNKENIDTNVKSEEKVQKQEIVDQEQKKVTHRYVKNTKCNATDNKYLNKCTKTAQLTVSISPDSVDVINREEVRYSEGSCDDGESFVDSLEEEVRLIDPISGNTIKLCEVTKSSELPSTKAFRKSAGDEIRRYSGEFLASLVDNRKVPSQDDIDRISKVTLDAPLLSKNDDMNSLGRRTIDSLREVERNRMAMLEKKGCQVIEDEREKIEELKRRVQNEAKQQYAETQQQLLKKAAEAEASPKEEKDKEDNDGKAEGNKESEEGDKMTSSPGTAEGGNDTENNSSLNESSLIEAPSPDKQLRHSQSDSYNSGNFIEDEDGGSQQDRDRDSSHYSQQRPISQLSDMSSENGGLSYGIVETPRRPKKASLSPRIREDLQRPLTRYLPIDQEDLNLRAHIESAGHQVDLCPHVIINATSCRGYLHKLGAKFHGWSKRWFVFDRVTKTLIYYSDKTEKKPRGGAYFQVIEEVYLDHLNMSKSPTPLTTFVIKTRQRRYYLMAPSGQAARIWIDVIFTGAQGYTEYMQ